MLANLETLGVHYVLIMERWSILLLGQGTESILSILFCDLFEDIRKVSGAVAVRLPEQQ